MKRELEHLAKFLHMAVDYKKDIGFKGQFYIEPKPKEPTKHQYDSDAAACLNFLREYDLLDDFQLNIETNHATLAGHTMQHELEVGGRGGRARLDRRQSRRRIARLGHRPVPDRHLSHHADHARRAQIGRLQDRRPEFRRQGAPRELRAGGSVPRAHRRHGRLRARPEDRRRHPQGRSARRIRQRTAMPPGTAASARRSRRARSASRNSKPTCSRRARPTRTRAAGRKCWRTSSTNSSEVESLGKRSGSPVEIVLHAIHRCACGHCQNASINNTMK